MSRQPIALTEGQRDQLRARWLAGWSVHRIGADIGASEAAVTKTAREMALQPRSRGGGSGNKTAAARAVAARGRA